jgi:Zn-finger nucleic acid-binding protein
MARCTSCSAPLPANTNCCNYCNTRSDVDLNAKHPYKVEKLATNRICPNCDKALQTIRLNTTEPLSIERCHTCFGLFFDKGEIELILQSSVSNVFDINPQHIDSINKDRYRKQEKIHYMKCPECRILMNRVNFGQRSGVVIDQCIIHGIWLDNGELTHLQEWKKAGGQLLQQEHAAEMEKQQQRQRDVLPGAATDYSVKTSGGFGGTVETDLVETVVGLLDKLF